MFAQTDCYEIGCMDNTYSRGKNILYVEKALRTRKTNWHGLKNEFFYVQK